MIFSAELGLGGDISLWTKRDVEDLVGKIRDLYSDSSVMDFVSALEILKELSPILPQPLIAEVPKIVVKEDSTIRTKPLHPDSFWALVRACWAYIDVYSTDIFAAREEFQTREAIFAKRKGETTDEHFQRFLDDPSTYVPRHCEHTTGANKKGEINYAALQRMLGYSSGLTNSNDKPSHVRRRAMVEESLALGKDTRVGSTNHRMTEVPTENGMVPWCEGLDEAEMSFEMSRLQTACFIFIASLTAMRSSEIMSIQCGDLGHQYGSPVVYGRVFKHRPGLGDRDFWWISEPVSKAIEVAGKIIGGHGQLFRGIRLTRKNQRFDIHKKILEFVEWVDETASRRGLNRISDSAVAAHRLRRTMSIVTAAQPDGEIALGVTLKHNSVLSLANHTTSGYGNPDSPWAKELKMDVADANAAHLVSEWSKNGGSEQDVFGPGAKKYRELMEIVEDIRQVGPPIVLGRPRVLRDLLRDEFSDFQLGTFNHCLGDISQAKCLEGLDDPDQYRPRMSECARATCRNSVIATEHLPLWEARRTELQLLLEDKKMASRHRALIEGELEEIGMALRGRS